MKAKTNFVQQICPTILTVEEVMNHPKKLLVIDVQNPKYVTNIIPRAQRLNEVILLKDIPKIQAVLVTCLSGKRSFRVAQQLIQRGYRDVYVLKGGVMAWQRAGYMTQLMKPVKFYIY